MATQCMATVAAACFRVNHTFHQRQFPGRVRSFSATGPVSGLPLSVSSLASRNIILHVFQYRYPHPHPHPHECPAAVKTFMFVVRVDLCWAT